MSKHNWLISGANGALEGLMAVEVKNELMRLEVVGGFDETPMIRSFELAAPGGGELPAFTAGAHIIVHLPGGHERQYSLSGDPADASRYRLGILKLENGRSGSAAFHLDICTRVREDTPFLDELDQLVSQGVATFHHDGGNPENGLQVEDSLREVDFSCHIYCCGPMGLMKAGRKTSRHWPRDNIHFKLFGSTQPAVKTGT